ncbi:MAG: VWA domain-containing protein [Bacteroidaceae bacterium]|nr:VWA domain-containing protein [Bacteroidaceae bacterium]
MFRFAHPEYLYLLILVPVIILFYVQGVYSRKKKLRLLGDAALLKDLMPDVSQTKRVVKFIVTLLTFVCLVIILARPQFGMKLETTERNGIEMVVALDVSNSMLATDVSPNRLSKAKMLVSRMADKMSNDKIALVVFAGQGFIQLPITSDFVSAKMFLDAISPSMIPAQGTNIGEAIRLSMGSFTNQKNVERAIVIITDGEDQAEEAEKMASEAAKKGIHIFVLGIGSPKGSTIPTKDGNTLRDREGNIVITKLNEAMASSIAAAGNGVYIHVDNSNIAQERLSYELNKLEKNKLGSTTYAEYAEQFPLVAFLALVGLAVVMLMSEKKKRFSDYFRFLKK